jgi:hypothetical protein
MRVNNTGPATTSNRSKKLTTNDEPTPRLTRLMFIGVPVAVATVLTVLCFTVDYLNTVYVQIGLWVFAFAVVWTFVRACMRH